jgi:uncharacterized protein YraI
MRIGRIAAVSSGFLAVTFSLSAFVAPIADAATGTVATSGVNLKVWSGPGSSYDPIGSLAPGTVVSFSCYAQGSAETGPWGTETIWDRLDSGGYVADAWIYTKSNGPVVPQCPAGSMTGTVSTASGINLTVREGPGVEYQPVRYYARGTAVTFSCYLQGNAMTGPWGTETIWDRLDSGGYVADAWIYTRSNGPVVPECTTAPGPASGSADQESYNRGAAEAWAWEHLNSPPRFSYDCTWYVSQALWAGGLPQSSLWEGNSYDWSLLASHEIYPGPTKDAVDANDLVNYLVSTGLASRVKISWTDNTASGAQPGDIIAYHWNTGEQSSEVDHLAFVYNLNAQGYPDVVQHSNADYRYWSWDPVKNGWIQQVDKVNGQDPGVWLIHINNSTVG